MSLQAGLPGQPACASSCGTDVESNKEHESLRPELVRFVMSSDEPLAVCWMASAGRQGFLCLV